MNFLRDRGDDESRLGRDYLGLQGDRGDRGFVTPADADEFRRRVPAASVIDVASGHNVQEEQPVALARLVARNT